jgi:hypothetical protein
MLDRAKFEHNLSFIFQRRLVYYRYRQNATIKYAFGGKQNIKDADGLRQAVISDLLENHLRAVRH